MPVGRGIEHCWGVFIKTLDAKLVHDILDTLWKAERTTNRVDVTICLNRRHPKTGQKIYRIDYRELGAEKLDAPSVNV